MCAVGGLFKPPCVGHQRQSEGLQFLRGIEIAAVYIVAEVGAKYVLVEYYVLSIMMPKVH